MLFNSWECMVLVKINRPNVFMLGMGAMPIV